MQSDANTHAGHSILQLARYGVVGVACNVAIYLVYLFISSLGVEPKAAMTCGYIMGVFIGFVGNRTWTFAHRGASAGSALRYALAHCLGYALNFAILVVFVDWLGLAHQWVQAVAVIVVAMLLFISFKYFVFRKDPCTSASRPTTSAS